MPLMYSEAAALPDAAAICGAPCSAGVCSTVAADKSE